MLAGRKTQTRRVLKLPTKNHSGGPIYERADMGGWAVATHGGEGCFAIGKAGERLPVSERAGLWHQTTATCVAARYAVGDRLWARETWRIAPDTREGWAPEATPCTGWVDYRAGGDAEVGAPSFSHVLDAFEKVTDVNWDRLPGTWRPSIFMPRWASRLILLVDYVRAERVQEISEPDAIAEGAAKVAFDEDAGKFFEDPDGTHRCGFAGLWAHINGAESWDANPWVVAVTFRVDRANIDQVPA